MALKFCPGPLSRLRFRKLKPLRQVLIIAITALAVWLVPSELRLHFQPSAHAATTFMVTNTNDSGSGSLRQAIVDANASSGQDLISFNIPGTGVQTITPPSSALPVITDSVVIDGYSQPGSSQNTLTDGDNAVLLVELNGINIGGSAGLQINASSCEVRGLVINRFADGIFISSSGTTTGNIIQGNFIGTDPSGTIARGNANGVQIQHSTNNLIGGTTPSARNVISGNGARGIFVSTGASTNVIQGNFIGTNASGTGALGNNSGGILSGGNGPDTIGGTVDGARNVISGNLNNAGIYVQSGTPTGPMIQGNLIGTDVTGTKALGNGFGIWLNFGPSLGNGTIGGTDAGARNVISGNRLDGVFISGDSRNNQLLGNLIGTDISGTKPLGNSRNGVQIDAFAASNKIGGTSAGQGNTIAFNGRNGILVTGSPSATGNVIRRNSIFSNGALGIDLGDDGVTPNDPVDADIGPNNVQNFPVITSVASDGTQTTITGALNSTPNTTFSLNFYSSSACDPSGNGEGTSPFGLVSTPVTTDANGNGTFGVTISVALPAGQVITATATDPAGNTSEFSTCDSTHAIGAVRFAVASTRVIEDVGFVTISVIRTGGNVGTVSVDYSTADITATASQDYTSTSGTLVFNDGETTKTFDVPILDDAVTEPDESFAVLLHNASNLDSLGYPYSEIVTLQDHNTPPTVSINSVSVSEGNSGTTNANFTVTLSPMTGRTVTVDYFTQALNATPGVDFQPVSGTLTFGPRITTGTIAVPVIGDVIDEFNETFNVVLTNPGGATISGNPGMGTIIDDDPPPSVSISDTSVIEGNSGTTFAQFNLSLSGPSGKFICVQASTSDGTASAASGDYHQVGGSITNPPAFISFNPGDTSATFTVQVFGDTLFEPDETFFANITPCNVDITIGRAQATGTIINDDTPTVRLTATDYPISENSANGYVTVSAIREGDSTSAASVNFATSDTSSLNASCSHVTGKASERCDYATSLGTLSWAAGEAGTKSFNIPIINDAWVEGTETFNVTLSNPTGVSLGTSTATVTIQDNDATLSSTNPIDGVDFFITEQYIDFLGRMPDQGGFANWQATLAPCPNGGFGEFDNPNCDRIHVAAGFFQSDEFLNRGYWAFRFYMVSYNQRPTYAQFIPDMAQVGGPKSPAEEEASKVAFADAYVQRPEFVAKYGAQSGQPLANALWLTAGLPGSPINAGSLTKGQILRNIAETSAAFNKFLTDGTVAIQYFGFLRRDPDTIGYQNNLTTLRNDPNNLRHMIFIFIYSSEYRGRFGTP